MGLHWPYFSQTWKLRQQLCSDCNFRSIRLILGGETCLHWPHQGRLCSERNTTTTFPSSLVVFGDNTPLSKNFLGGCTWLESKTWLQLLIWLLQTEVGEGHQTTWSAVYARDAHTHTHTHVHMHTCMYTHRHTHTHTHCSLQSSRKYTYEWSCPLHFQCILQYLWLSGLTHPNCFMDTVFGWVLQRDRQPSLLYCHRLLIHAVRSTMGECVWGVGGGQVELQANLSEVFPQHNALVQLVKFLGGDAGLTTADSQYFGWHERGLEQGHCECPMCALASWGDHTTCGWCRALLG